jgi:hypothetical protein
MRGAKQEDMRREENVGFETIQPSPVVHTNQTNEVSQPHELDHISRMNQLNQTTQTAKEVTLFDYWHVIHMRWKAINAFRAVIVLATLGVSYMLPKIFESTATILP